MLYWGEGSPLLELRKKSNDCILGKSCTDTFFSSIITDHNACVFKIPFVHKYIHINFGEINKYKDRNCTFFSDWHKQRGPQQQSSKGSSLRPCCTRAKSGQTWPRHSWRGWRSHTKPCCTPCLRFPRALTMPQSWSKVWWELANKEVGMLMRADQKERGERSHIEQMRKLAVDYKHHQKTWCRVIIVFIQIYIDSHCQNVMFNELLLLSPTTWIHPECHTDGRSCHSKTQSTLVCSG